MSEEPSPACSTPLDRSTMLLNVYDDWSSMGPGAPRGRRLSGEVKSCALVRGSTHDYDPARGRTWLEKRMIAVFDSGWVPLPS